MSLKKLKIKFQRRFFGDSDRRRRRQDVGDGRLQLERSEANPPLRNRGSRNRHLQREETRG